MDFPCATRALSGLATRTFLFPKAFATLVSPLLSSPSLSSSLSFLVLFICNSRVTSIVELRRSSLDFHDGFSKFRFFEIFPLCFLSSILLGHPSLSLFFSRVPQDGIFHPSHRSEGQRKSAQGECCASRRQRISLPGMISPGIPLDRRLPTEFCFLFTRPFRESRLGSVPPSTGSPWRQAEAHILMLSKETLLLMTQLLL